MLCHRICRRGHRALDGEGARLYGGRWNSPGVPVVYTSSTIALAALEYLVHLDQAEAPRDLVATRLDLPDDLAIATVATESLPTRWYRYPAPVACRKAGDAWLAAGKTAVLRVPSAPVPEEWNYLLNPRHQDFHLIRRAGSRTFAFDDRLLR
ncbi:MAG TPA: RES family NAD+ phosphorylase [Gemmatimonadales bacterium]|jgi:RES domain-containing protein